MAYVNKNQWKL